MNVVIVPIIVPPNVIYLPFENVAPSSPNKDLRKRSSAVLVRDMILASTRFIDNAYFRLHARMLSDVKAW